MSFKTFPNFFDAIILSVIITVKLIKSNVKTDQREMVTNFQNID